MRKSFDSLSGLVREFMLQDPLGGDVFLFFNRRKNQVKLLCWDRDGFAIFYKRLEKGTFEIPTGEQNVLNAEIVSCILQGISLQSVRKRKRYKRAG